MTSIFGPPTMILPLNGPPTVIVPIQPTIAPVGLQQAVANGALVSGINWKVVAKVTIVALLISGLIVATIFSGGAAAAAVAAGGAMAGTLTGVFCGLSAGAGISAIAGIYYAAVNNMGKDTGRNLEDTGWFVVSTMGTALILIYYLVIEGFRSGLYIDILRAIARS